MDFKNILAIRNLFFFAILNQIFIKFQTKNDDFSSNNLIYFVLI